jgi:hypothetical protein
MGAMGFVLNHLHGIGGLKTFTNGRTILKVITTYVSTTTKYVCKYIFRCNEELKVLHLLFQIT